MKCQRALDADLPGLLEGHGDDPEFLAHYAGCPDCAAEVGVWQELHGLLRVGVTTNGTHPSEEQLVALVDKPGSLGVGERAALDRHVASCRPCGDEARLLRTIDVATAVAAIDVGGNEVAATDVAPTPAAIDTTPPMTPNETTAVVVTAPPVALVAHPESAPAVAGPVEASDSGRAPTPAVSAGRFSRLVWHPAFAYALVAVLLVPLVHDQVTRRASPRPESAAPALERAAPAAAPAAEAPAPSLVEEPELAPPPVAEALAKAAEPRLDAVAERREQVAALRDATDVGAPRQAKRAAAAAAAGAPSAPAGAGAAPEGAMSARGGAMAAPHGATSMDAAAAPPRAVLDVGPDAYSALPFAAAANGALLRIAPPAGAGARLLDVRVRRRTGGRELFERLSAQADAIELEIPAHWLLPGDYEVTVGAADGRERARQGESDGAAPRGRLRFSVGPEDPDGIGVAAPGAPR